MSPLTKLDPPTTGYHQRAQKQTPSRANVGRILNSGTVAPALHIGQLVDFLYSILHELLEFFVRLDPVEHGDGVSPAEDFLHVQQLF